MEVARDRIGIAGMQETRLSPTAIVAMRRRMRKSCPSYLVQAESILTRSRHPRTGLWKKHWIGTALM
eukprot:834984-Rhodomonas_salina.1